MDILKRMNIAVQYIEDNITEKIDYNEIAKKVFCSSYNFHRMFTFICDISPSEYVRRRRLTFAVFDLIDNNLKVIDVAFKYGYESTISFARAFKSMHGFSPSKAKNNKNNLIAFPRMSFQIKIKGVEKMEYRIEKKGKLEFYGVEAIVSNIGDDKYYSNAGKLWEELFSDGRYNDIYGKRGYDNHPEFNDLCSVHAVMNYKKTPKDTFAYMVGAFKTKDSKTEGYSTITIPETTYAIFPSIKFKWGDIGSIINNMMNKIYTEWFPTTEYEKDDKAELEVYGGSEGSGDVAYIELWIPIKKK